MPMSSGLFGGRFTCSRAERLRSSARLHCSGSENAGLRQHRLGLHRLVLLAAGIASARALPSACGLLAATQSGTQISQCFPSRKHVQVQRSLICLLYAGA